MRIQTKTIEIRKVKIRKKKVVQFRVFGSQCTIVKNKYIVASTYVIDKVYYIILVRYIGRTIRIKEYHPVRLTKGTISTIRSSILKHMMDSNHFTNNEKSLKNLYKTPVNQYHTTRLKHLNMAEAILINLYKPELCSQKKLFHNVLLPWPSLFR